jgi:hypothetical protein
MTAISTIISLYKQKYHSVNRSTNPGSNVRRSGDEAILNWKKGNLGGLGGTPSTIGTDIGNAVKYNDAIASLNVGLSIFQDIQQKINGSLIDMVESITMFEDREKKLTQTFKVGTKELALRTLAYNKLQTTLKATNDEMAEYRANMEANSAFSGKAFAKAINNENTYIKRQITAQSYLKKNTDLTSDQIQSLELYAAGSGRALDRQILATDKLAQSMEDGIAPSETNETIFASIADLSSDIRMQYKGMGGNLEMAVLKAKRLGISMEQLHKTGAGLLNIEESVGKELEYQLLSGRRLVDADNNSLLNAYREATITGDMTKQANIMNQILETQADVLNGRNFAAKEQLATTLEMSAKDLMYMKEKKDLQDLINKSGASGNVDELLKSSQAMKAFKTNLLQTGAVASDTILKGILSLETNTENRRSPAEKMYAELLSYRQTGLNVKIKDEANLNDARKAATDYKTAISKPFDKLLQNSAIASLVGGYNIIAQSSTIMENAIKSVSKSIPFFSTIMIEAVDKMRLAVKAVLGLHGMQPGDRNKDLTNPPGGGKGTHKDAILNINDGVIAKFHPNDKITTVVASPYGAMNERIAGKIANPKPNNSSTAQIIQLTAAINKLISTQPAPEQTNNKSIVSAIQTAMGNVNITVALDPMAIDKEIKFRSGNLNG